MAVVHVPKVVVRGGGGKEFYSIDARKGVKDSNEEGKRSSWKKNG